MTRFCGFENGDFMNLQGLSGVLIAVGYFFDSFLWENELYVKRIGLYGTLFGQTH